MIAFPNCKINLGLHILQKRTDGFHDLQTVFYPFPLTDALEMVQHNGPDTVLNVTGILLDTTPQENICYRAWLLLKKDFPGLPVVRMHLHKVIPSGAGLGGGSADGAFALVLLNKKFRLGLSEEQLSAYALQLGSDCPFFILNRPCLAEGRGEILTRIDIDLESYTIVLVYPQVHITTSVAFAKIIPSKNRMQVNEIITKPVPEWKKLLVNDFEKSIFETYPEIAAIKKTLYDNGAVYASMSGTGSTVYGLFEKGKELSFDFPDHYLVKSGKE